MSRLRLKISMSLDGFVAGPDQSVRTRSASAACGCRVGLPARRLARSARPRGGEVNASTAVVEESLANIGATIMGRNMFGGHPGAWREKPWNGWWGDNPPFHHPVFVLTHHAREPLALEGGTTFTFVTDGIEAALERRAAAGGKDVSLGGRRERGAAISRRRPGGRNGDQPGPDAPRRRRASVRRVSARRSGLVLRERLPRPA